MVNNLHPYATDSKDRNRIPFCLSVMSIIVAWLLSKGLDVWGIKLSWYFSVPSVMGFYGLFHVLFDKYLWRMSFIRIMGSVKNPDLNGVWEGEIISSYNNESRYPAKLEIKQTWRYISILLETDNSRSHSFIASITENTNGKLLSYQYLNEPRAVAVNTMHTHRGTAWLSLSPDSQRLEGEYYTGRDRQTNGVLHFKKKEP